MSNSVDTPRIVQSLANSFTIVAFSSSVWMVAMMGNWGMRLGLIELITIGNIFSLIVAVLQCSVGSNVANQGYPKSNSSRPRSAYEEAHFMMNAFSEDIQIEVMSDTPRFVFRVIYVEYFLGVV